MSRTATETERAAFRSHAASVGLRPEDLNRAFRHSNGKLYRLIGMVPERAGCPLICVPLSGGTRTAWVTRAVVAGLAGSTL